MTKISNKEQFQQNLEKFKRGEKIPIIKKPKSLIENAKVKKKPTLSVVNDDNVEKENTKVETQNNPVTESYDIPDFDPESESETEEDKKAYAICVEFDDKQNCKNHFYNVRRYGIDVFLKNADIVRKAPKIKKTKGAYLNFLMKMEKPIFTRKFDKNR